MAQNRNPKYIEKKDFEDIYKIEDRFERPVFEEEKPREERKERLIHEVARRALPRMEEDKLKTLNRKPSEVIGTIFDKVKFLGDRVTELESMINDRVEIHKGIISDIDEDIAITNDMAGHSMDLDERRNLKLDMSILRKEKRHESVQFWHDIVELRTELREMVEKFQMESQIGDLFNDLKKDDVDDADEDDEDSEKPAKEKENKKAGKDEDDEFRDIDSGKSRVEKSGGEDYIPKKRKEVRETSPRTEDHRGPAEKEED